MAGNAGLGPVAPPPAWPGFRPLRVTAIEQESSTVSSFRLADPDGAAAAHRRRRASSSPSGCPHRVGRTLLRSYSLSGPPGAAEYRISVQREPHGAGSTLLHETVHAGALLDTAAPRGTFLLRPSTGPVLLVSAGVGATPRARHAARPGRRPIGARGLVAAHRARRRTTRLPRRDRRPARPAAPLPPARPLHPAAPHRPGPGRRPAGRARRALAALGLPTDADAYLCGPATFLADLTTTLVGLGLAPARVHTEVFGAAPGMAPGIVGSAPGRPQPPPGHAGSRARRDVRPQRSHRQLGSRLREPARTGRGLSMCRCDGAAAPACARHAGPAWSRGWSPTPRTPSSRPATARPSCAARSPSPSWSSTSDDPAGCRTSRRSAPGRYRNASRTTTAPGWTSRGVVCGHPGRVDSPNGPAGEDKDEPS